MSTISLEQYERAERTAAIAEARRGVVVHAAVTVLVWAIVITLNVMVASEFPWSVFPVAGTSLGLLAHWWFGYRKVEGAVRQHQLDVERRVLETTRTR